MCVEGGGWGGREDSGSPNTTESFHKNRPNMLKPEFVLCIHCIDICLHRTVRCVVSYTASMCTNGKLARYFLRDYTTYAHTTVPLN